MPTKFKLRRPWLGEKWNDKGVYTFLINDVHYKGHRESEIQEECIFWLKNKNEIDEVFLKGCCVEIMNMETKDIHTVKICINPNLSYIATIFSKRTLNTY